MPALGLGKQLYLIREQFKQSFQRIFFVLSEKFNIQIIFYVFTADLFEGMRFIEGVCRKECGSK